MLGWLGLEAKWDRVQFAEHLLLENHSFDSELDVKALYVCDKGRK